MMLVTLRGPDSSMTHHLHQLEPVFGRLHHVRPECMADTIKVYVSVYSRTVSSFTPGNRESLPLNRVPWVTR
jgi:hypothetical protein